MPRAVIAAFAVMVLSAGTAQGQITARTPSYLGHHVASLEDILVNSLHATGSDQRIFIQRVVQQTESNRLETRLVLAVMYYAQQQNATFPFPYFEQILRHQAAKRGVRLPSVASLTSTRIPRSR